MNTTTMARLVGLFTSIVFASAACVIDNTGSLEPADDDDDSAAVGDDDDATPADDDDAVDENEVCPGSFLQFWTRWYRDRNSNSCLDWHEWNDDTDEWVGVATCGDGTYSTVWAEGEVAPGLPEYPFLDPTDAGTWCPEDDDAAGDDDSDAGDDDAADDDDTADDDDDATPAGDDDAAGDDDTSDDDDTAGDPPDTSDEVCEGGWVIQWTRWWLDVNNNSCLDSSESDDLSSDPWIDVATCSSAAITQYAYWEFNTEVWVNSVPEDPFLPGTTAYACP